MRHRTRERLRLLEMVPALAATALLWPIGVLLDEESPAMRAYREALKEQGFNHRREVRRLRRLFRHSLLSQRRVLVVADDGVVSFYCASQGAQVTSTGGTGRFAYFAGTLPVHVDLAPPGGQYDIIITRSPTCTDEELQAFGGQVFRLASP